MEEPFRRSATRPVEAGVKRSPWLSAERMSNDPSPRTDHGSRDRTGGASILSKEPARPDRRGLAGSAEDDREWADVTHLHQIIILDDFRTPSRLPESISRNSDAVRSIYPHAKYQLWSGEDLRAFLKNSFDTDVLWAFETLTSYAYKCDLARLCLLHELGGLYVDLGVQTLRPWDIPADRTFGAFRDLPFIALNWATMQSGLLWARPRQPEMESAIRFIVENCRNRHYGATPLHPTGPVLLGKATVAAALRRGPMSAAAEIGTCQRLTPESSTPNVAYVSRRGRVVALRTKQIAGDLSHLGVTGGNDYNRIWRARQAYGEQHRWLSAIRRTFGGRAFAGRNAPAAMEPGSAGGPSGGLMVHRIALDLDGAADHGDRDVQGTADGALGRLYPGMTYKSWTRDDVRELIRTDFDGDLLNTFDEAAATDEFNLALFCVMHTFGGVHLGRSVTVLNRWEVPKRCGIAGFSRALLPSADWMDVDTGLLWSRPRRPEWADAIANLRAIGPSRADAGAWALGRAFAMSMDRRGHTANDDQWVGDARRVAAPDGAQTLRFVAPDGSLVGLRTSPDLR